MYIKSVNGLFVLEVQKNGITHEFTLTKQSYEEKDYSKYDAKQLMRTGVKDFDGGLFEAEHKQAEADKRSEKLTKENEELKKRLAVATATIGNLASDIAPGHKATFSTQSPFCSAAAQPLAFKGSGSAIDITAFRDVNKKELHDNINREIRQGIKEGTVRVTNECDHVVPRQISIGMEDRTQFPRVDITIR